MRPLLLAAILAGCTPPSAALALPRLPAPIVVTWDGVEIDGAPLSCAPDGRPVPVAWDATIQRLAWSSLEPPLIRLRPDIQQQPRALQIYALLHECGHLTLRTTAEDAADCWAATASDMQHLLGPADWRSLREALTRDGGEVHWRSAEACRVAPVSIEAP